MPSPIVQTATRFGRAVASRVAAVPAALSGSFRTTDPTSQAYRLRSGTKPRLARADTHRDARTLQDLIADCRDLMRTNHIARGIVEARAALDVGDRPTYNGTTQDSAWNRDAGQLFEAWAATADPAGQLGLTGLLARVSAEWAESGGVVAQLIDAGGTGVYRVGLRLLEVERLSNPSGHLSDRDPDPETEDPDSPTGYRLGLRSGVAFDAVGRPRRYYLRRWDSTGTNLLTATDAVDDLGSDGLDGSAWLVSSPAHLASGQYRAEPDLAPMLDRLGHLFNAQDGQLVAYEMASILAMFIKRREGGAGRSVAGDVANAQRLDDGRPQLDDWEPPEIGRGVMVDGDPTIEDVKSVSPSVPTAEFRELVWQELHFICNGLGISPGLAAAHFIRNYHASRSEVSVTWPRVMRRQRVLQDKVIRPVWRAVIGQAIADGELPHVPGWDRCRATLGQMPVLDPAQDVESMQRMVAAGFVLPQQAVLRFTGRTDFETYLAEYAEQMAAAKDAGFEFASQPKQVSETVTAPTPSGGTDPA